MIVKGWYNLAWPLQLNLRPEDSSILLRLAAHSNDVLIYVNEYFDEQYLMLIQMYLASGQ